VEINIRASVQDLGASYEETIRTFHRLKAATNDFKLPFPVSEFDSDGVRVARLLCGESHSLFAKETGLGLTAVEDMEKGIRQPSQQECNAIAVRLHRTFTAGLDHRRELFWRLSDELWGTQPDEARRHMRWTWLARFFRANSPPIFFLALLAVVVTVSLGNIIAIVGALILCLATLFVALVAEMFRIPARLEVYLHFLYHLLPHGNLAIYRERLLKWAREDLVTETDYTLPNWAVQNTINRAVEVVVPRCPSEPDVGVVGSHKEKFREKLRSLAMDIGDYDLKNLIDANEQIGRMEREYLEIPRPKLHMQPPLSRRSRGVVYGVITVVVALLSAFMMKWWTGDLFWSSTVFAGVVGIMLGIMKYVVGE
jgi:hypothetical protein